MQGAAAPRASAGPAMAMQARVAERDIAWVRLAIIAFNVGVYAFFLPHDPARHAAAVAVSIVALLYAVIVVAFRPYEHLPVLRTSSYTLLTDSLLIIFWLYATGGIESPFYPLWVLSLVAVVFRFRASVVAVATATYILGDVAMLAISGDLPAPVPVAVRAMYIATVGALGTLLGMRWSEAVASREAAVAEVARRDQLLQETDRFRVLASAAFEGLVIHRDGRIVEANPASGRIFGSSAHELVGRHASELVDPESRDELAERLAAPQSSAYHLWIRRADGARRRVRVQARDISYHGRPARVTAIRDVTDEYEAQEALLQAAQQQAEISRLQELDDFKTQFINTAAHELNTPMTPIKLQLHMLKEDLEGLTTAPPRSLLVLERNMDRLAALVSDLLDVARMESGKLRVRPRTVDLVPTCDEAAQIFSASAGERDIHIEHALPARLVCHADPERVLQILTNLVSNAIKFTPAGGTITVHGRETRQGVRVEVTDTGAGMEPEQQEMLFRPFSQAHQDPHIPGTGLGLYISRNLVEAMGGRIGCQSMPGEGSTFWFELPKATAATESEAPEAPREGLAAPRARRPD